MSKSSTWERMKNVSQSSFTALTRAGVVDREVNRSCVYYDATQRGGAGGWPAVIYLLRCVRRRPEITVPGDISQYSGIQRLTVWYFSTDCWPAVSGVARPCYLLPGS